ncbi:hypothetical protein CROQUDRAFT_166539 [Cronartium quercuum f. sp. fusiforme G11]|uniref:Uncharacterized protein n=1 Tax=Cronartium quercuum f. sp. fusiforme G11 TaxID=708437 RepID=A0A9P6NDR3_9BASI|nr:hypothetical protein CROQUDRAFT_166539 [Cronartium quercuum f. sp. fusiforme G11]
MKAVPVKIDNISKLLSDGSNLDIWIADIEQYLTMIPGAADQLKEGALSTVAGWKDELAQGVNSMIHWTIDRQLGMRRRGIACLCLRYML